MPHSYGLSFAPIDVEVGRMSLKIKIVTAGNAAARIAKRKTGMYSRGIFESPRCYHSGQARREILVMARAAEDFYRVRQQFCYCVERFHCAFRAAGKIQDDRTTSHAHNSAG